MGFPRRHLDSLVDRFVPAPLASSPDSSRQARTTVGVALTMFVVPGIIGTVRASMEGLTPAAMAALGAAAIGAATPFVLRATASLIVALSLMLGVGIATLVVIASYEGGIVSPSLVWTPFVPLVAAFAAGMRVATVFTLGCILALVWLFVSGSVQPPFPEGAIRFTTICGAVVFGWGVAALYERNRRRGEAEIGQLKDDFVATVSHELRTPLTSIHGALGLLSGGAAGSLPETARSLVDVASRNSRRLADLIEDLLDLSKVESGKIAYAIAPAEAASVAASAAEMSDGYARSHGNDIVLESDGAASWITADAGRVQQVLTNLLSNAIKHSPPGAPVRLALTEVDGFVRFTVTDEGDGIPPELQDRVFDKFVSAEGLGGTGLGLAISKRIIEDLGGRISLRSRPGEGSSFSVELPAGLRPKEG